MRESKNLVFFLCLWIGCGTSLSCGANGDGNGRIQGLSETVSKANRGVGLGDPNVTRIINAANSQNSGQSITGLQERRNLKEQGIFGFGAGIIETAQSTDTVSPSPAPTGMSLGFLGSGSQSQFLSTLKSSDLDQTQSFNIATPRSDGDSTKQDSNQFSSGKASSSNSSSPSAGMKALTRGASDLASDISSTDLTAGNYGGNFGQVGKSEQDIAKANKIIGHFESIAGHFESINKKLPKFIERLRASGNFEVDQMLTKLYDATDNMNRSTQRLYEATDRAIKAELAASQQLRTIKDNPNKIVTLPQR